MGFSYSSCMWQDKSYQHKGCTATFPPIASTKLSMAAYFKLLLALSGKGTERTAVLRALHISQSIWPGAQAGSKGAV